MLIYKTHRVAKILKIIEATSIKLMNLDSSSLLLEIIKLTDVSFTFADKD